VTSCTGGWGWLRGFISGWGDHGEETVIGMVATGCRAALAHVGQHVKHAMLINIHPAKQAAAAALFEKIKAGALEVAAPDTAIADVVYVPSSPRLYKLPRAVVRELLTPLVRLTAFKRVGHNIRLVPLDPARSAIR
jgi:hypothetical protein